MDTLPDEIEIECVRRTRRTWGIAGYYVVDRLVCSTEPEQWRWENRGNGWEVAHDGVTGPFASYKEAAQWAREFYSVETENHE